MANYRKGADYERKIVNKERTSGNLSFRSAGSHSPIDVCSINHKERIITLFQCKYGKSYTENSKRQIEEKLKFLEGFYQVQIKVI